MPYSPKIVDEMIEEGRKEAKIAATKDFGPWWRLCRNWPYCLGSA
jgi:hypothetical protein